MSDPDSRRALRRHHRERVIAKARIATRRWHSSYDQDWRDPLSAPSHAKADAQAVRLADHLCACSKAYHGCGNRRHGGFEDPRTFPEVRADVDFAEALAEVFSSTPLDSALD